MDVLKMQQSRTVKNASENSVAESWHLNMPFDTSTKVIDEQPEV